MSSQRISIRDLRIIWCLNSGGAAQCNSACRRDLSTPSKTFAKAPSTTRPTGPSWRPASTTGRDRSRRRTAEGHQRWLCPASDGASTVRCDLKSRSEVDDGKTKVRIRPTTTLREHRPTVCRQQSVMIDPERGAKFAQTLPYGDPEHERVYATLRNSVEGTNGFVKDSAFEGVGASQRRRIRGVAAQSLLVAFQLIAANFRKMDAYIKAVQRAAAGLFRRPRRRRTRSIADWNPQADIGGHRGPSPPTG